MKIDNAYHFNPVLVDAMRACFVNLHRVDQMSDGSWVVQLSALYISCSLTIWTLATYGICDGLPA